MCVVEGVRACVFVDACVHVYLNSLDKCECVRVCVCVCVDVTDQVCCKCDYGENSSNAPTEML